jgi:hypothetical protein
MKRPRWDIPALVAAAERQRGMGRIDWARIAADYREATGQYRHPADCMHRLFAEGISNESLNDDGTNCESYDDRPEIYNLYLDDEAERIRSEILAGKRAAWAAGVLDA